MTPSHANGSLPFDPGAKGGRTHKLDATDLRILNELQHSSNLTNAALSQRVGISPPSTLERVRKLERAGVITGYVALLDPDSITKTIQAIVHVSLSHHSSASLSKAKESLSKFEEVQACWHTAGDEDFVLKVIVADMPQYERFISEKLSTVPNIGKIRTAFVLSTVKHTTQIPMALNGAGGQPDASAARRGRRSM